MIIEIKVKEENNERELFESLIIKFNNVAQELKKKYYLMLDGNFPKLVKPVIFNFGQSLGDNSIFYNKLEDKFYFHRGIDEYLFEEIKEIIEKIDMKQKFSVEVI